MARLGPPLVFRYRRLIAALCALPWLGLTQAKAEPPIKVAIVGLAHGHVEGFLMALPKHSDVQLVGIAEGDSNLAAKYKSRFGLADTLFYKQEANMIEKTRPQAILVYTSIAEHRPAIEIAAQYGVSVMVEKPLTISVEDALAIKRTAEHYKIQVLVNYETTWYASNREAYEQVRQGNLGEIRRVVIHDGHQGPKEIGVPPEFLSWLTDPATNGAGALYDFGCYAEHGQAAVLFAGGRRCDGGADVSAGAGGAAGVVELAVRAQGHGGLRGEGLCNHGGGRQAASAQAE
jgi:predicted dehydrogenase